MKKPAILFSFYPAGEIIELVEELVCQVPDAVTKFPAVVARFVAAEKHLH